MKKKILTFMVGSLLILCGTSGIMAKPHRHYPSRSYLNFSWFLKPSSLGIKTFIFLLGEKAVSASYQYHSLCIFPKFSPDEKCLAFWDREKIGDYEWKNTLKIFNIEKNQTTIAAERIFDVGDITGTDDSEDPVMYQTLDWSPDSRYIAFGLNLHDVDIYDTQAEKVISSLNVCGQACAEVPVGWKKRCCYGYFDITWLDQNNIRVGYTSEVSPHEWTRNTYGLIEKANGSFKIKQAVLPADAVIYKTLYDSYDEYKKVYILIVETSSTGEVTNVRKKEYDWGYSFELLFAARENSRKPRHRLRSGKRR